MLRTGLVSISFRDKNTDELIKAVKEAGLDAIEWGGDVHVPHGDIEKARQVKKKCTQNDILTPSYGSYLKMEEQNLFTEVVETASVLKAKTIRVWAGTKASAGADEDYFRKIANNISTFANIAIKKDITVSLEYHMGTLTDTYASFEKLIKLIDSNSVFGYYQPQVDRSYIENLNELENIIELNKLTNVHVFNWDQKGRYPLKDGIKEWEGYIKALKNLKKERYLLLEFSCDDTIKQFLEDAEILKSLLSNHL